MKTGLECLSGHSVFGHSGSLGLLLLLRWLDRLGISKEIERVVLLLDTLESGKVGSKVGVQQYLSWELVTFLEENRRLANKKHVRREIGRVRTTVG